MGNVVAVIFCDCADPSSSQRFEHRLGEFATIGDVQLAIQSHREHWPAGATAPTRLFAADPFHPDRLRCLVCTDVSLREAVKGRMILYWPSDIAAFRNSPERIAKTCLSTCEAAGMSAAPPVDAACVDFMSERRIEFDAAAKAPRTPWPIQAMPLPATFQQSTWTSYGGGAGRGYSRSLAFQAEGSFEDAIHSYDEGESRSSHVHTLSLGNWLVTQSHSTWYCHLWFTSVARSTERPPSAGVDTFMPPKSGSEYDVVTLVASASSPSCYCVTRDGVRLGLKQSDCS